MTNLTFDSVTNSFDLGTFNGADWMTQSINLIWGLKPIPFTIIAVILIGYFFRAIPRFNNEYLWMVCGLAGSAIFPVMAPHHVDEPIAQHIARGIVSGLVLGMGAWAIHDKILSKYEDRIPFLKNLVKTVDKIGQKPEESSDAPA